MYCEFKNAHSKVNVSVKKNLWSWVILKRFVSMRILMCVHTHTHTVRDLHGIFRIYPFSNTKIIENPIASVLVFGFAIVIVPVLV